MSDHDDALYAALRLLKGDAVASGERIYLVHDSPEELRARAALVSILEGDAPVPPAIRYQLAALFDPDKELSWEERRLKFEFKRVGGKESKVAVQRLWEIYHRNKAGERITGIVRDIAERDGLEDNSLMKAWGKFKEYHLPLLEGIVPVPSTGGLK